MYNMNFKCNMLTIMKSFMNNNCFIKNTRINFFINTSIFLINKILPT